MSKLTIIIIAVIGIVVGIVATSLFFKSCGKDPAISETIYVHDTTVVTRYLTELKTDTVIKWYERIIYKNVHPDVVYEQKVDSIFIERIRYKDVMLKVEKSGNKVRIYAVNQKDSLLKEYIFSSVGNDFTATATDNNIFLKTKKFYWSGLITELKATSKINKLAEYRDYEYTAGIKTGVSYYDKLYLLGGIEYPMKLQEPLLKLELNYIIK
jgi:hypothetical protein